MLGRHSGVAEMTARLVFSLKLTRLIFAKLQTLQYDIFENQFVGIIAHNSTQPTWRRQLKISLPSKYFDE